MESKKGSRHQLVHKDVNLLPSHPKKNNKTGKRKGCESQLACRIIGHNGHTKASLLTRVVTPNKQARQPITMEFVIDPTFLQVFKRRKWLLGSCYRD